MKRKNETESKQSKKKCKVDLPLTVKLAQEASLKINRNENDSQSYWPPLDKKSLKKMEIYREYREYAAKGSIEKNHSLQKILGKSENIQYAGWHIKRFIYAAAYLAGTDPKYDGSIYHAIKNNDGYFIHFLATECKVDITNTANDHSPIIYCKTLAMIHLIKSLGIQIPIDKKSPEYNLIHRSYDNDCNWQVLKYCIENKIGYPDFYSNFNNLNRWKKSLEYFPWNAGVSYTLTHPHNQSELYNHLKKLQMLFQKASICSFKKNRFSSIKYGWDHQSPYDKIAQNNITIVRQSLAWPNFALPSYLELLGNDYGDFPARKIYGQQAFKSELFDLKLIFEKV